jgi:hypothetical protein
MTTVPLVSPPTDHPGRPSAHSVWITAWRLLRRATVVTWMVLRTLAVVTARVLLWCSADGRRLRTIAIGLATCAAAGALVGLGTGLVMARLVELALSIVV